MPIEIRELQIKAAVSSQDTRKPAQNSNANATDIQGIKQEIIREVTEEVLKMIQLKLER